jgi:hypothetical protein
MTLLKAIYDDDVVEVRRLVAMGVNVDQRDENGATALHYASDKGQVEVIKVLVEHGADKEAKDAQGCTPLHLAADNGHVEATKLLIELCADKAENVNGQTPMHYAASNGHVEAIKALGQLGVNKEAKDANGDTPLQLAIKTLVQLGAQVDRCTGCGWRHSSPHQRPGGSSSGGAGVAGARTPARTRTEGGGDQRAYSAGG